MRKSVLIPLSAFALVVGFGVGAVGQSHAQAATRGYSQQTTSKDWCTGAWVCQLQGYSQPSQPIIVTQAWTSAGTATDVPATGQTTWQGIDHGQLSAGNAFTDTVSVTSYHPAANGCAAQVYQFTRTFTRSDSYTYEALGLSCPMTGQRGQTKSTGTLVITGGTGQYKGVSGTGTYTYVGTAMRNKAGQSRELATTAKGQVNITFPAQ
jgi:hypothetical protein